MKVEHSTLLEAESIRLTTGEIIHVNINSLPWEYYPYKDDDLKRRWIDQWLNEFEQLGYVAVWDPMTSRTLGKLRDTAARLNYKIEYVRYWMDKLEKRRREYYADAPIGPTGTCAEKEYGIKVKDLTITPTITPNEEKDKPVEWRLVMTGRERMKSEPLTLAESITLGGIVLVGILLIFLLDWQVGIVVLGATLGFLIWVFSPSMKKKSTKDIIQEQYDIAKEAGDEELMQLFSRYLKQK